MQIVEDGGARRGITLVELLVAISIIAMLMAIAARMIDFSVEDRRTREAGRAITIFFGSARNGAMETGRPCGVMLRRLEDRPLCVVGLDQVEVPPPYGGDTLDAAARLQLTGPPGGTVATVVAKFRAGEFSDGLIRKHDQIQFNHQGLFYEIVTSEPDSDGDGFLDFNFPDAADNDGDGFIDNYYLTLQVDLRQGQMVPWPMAGDPRGLSQAVPYQIIRRPRKSAVGGLQLPLRAVIDMEFSGTDDHSIGADTNLPVYIMFSPNGSLERVYHHGEMHPGIEPIFLLVGKQERVPGGSAEDGLANWQDLKNLWVTLNPQTGLVTTTEVAAVDPTITDPVVGVPLARDIAREGQSMGGR